MFYFLNVFHFFKWSLWNNGNLNISVQKLKTSFSDKMIAYFVFSMITFSVTPYPVKQQDIMFFIHL